MDRQTLGAVGLMLLAMTLIPLGDAAGKLLTEGHGLAPGFVAFARFAVGAALIAALLGARPHAPLYRDPRVWLRSALIAAGIACILAALRTEDFATVIGAFFVGPIASYALSAWLLGEPASRARTALVVAGFGGVMLVVRPGLGLTPGLALALAAGLFYGGYLTASRWLADLAPPRQLMLAQTVMGTLLLAPAGVAGLGGPPITGEGAALLAASGLASATGNLLLVVAYRRARATVLAPFVYAQLVVALALGCLVWGTVPDGPALIGMAVIAAAGLGTLALRRGA